MSVKYYSSKEEREKIEAEYHKIGYRISHDDFIDENGNPTDGTSGKLTLIDTTTEKINPDSVLVLSLMEKLNNNSITFEELKNLLRLRNGQL